MHFWVVSVLQKPGFQCWQFVIHERTLNITCCLPKKINVIIKLKLSQKTSNFGVSVFRKKQGFDAGFFLHKWHAFGEASIFRRNDASILRKLPWKEPFNLEVAALFWTCFPYLPGKDPFILHQFAPPSFLPVFFLLFLLLRHSTAAICLTFANLQPLWGLQGLSTILRLLWGSLDPKTISAGGLFSFRIVLCKNWMLMSKRKVQPKGFKTRTVEKLGVPRVWSKLSRNAWTWENRKSQKKKTSRIVPL